MKTTTLTELQTCESVAEEITERYGWSDKEAHRMVSENLATVRDVMDGELSFADAAAHIARFE